RRAALFAFDRDESTRAPASDALEICRAVLVHRTVAVCVTGSIASGTALHADFTLGGAVLAGLNRVIAGGAIRRDDVDLAFAANSLGRGQWKIVSVAERGAVGLARRATRNAMRCRAQHPREGDITARHGAGHIPRIEHDGANSNGCAVSP